MKFIGIVGTNSKKSTNRDLLVYMQKHFAPEAEIELVEIKDLPVFNKPAERKVPEAVTKIADKVKKADGVIISTPEYDHAIPAVLMNALAWLSYGITPLLNKPVMITGASYGQLGSSRAQAQLRQILDAPELKASVIPGSEFLLPHSLEAFDQKGDLKDQELVKKLDALFADFCIFVEITKKLSNAKGVLQEEVASFDWEKL